MRLSGLSRSRAPVRGPSIERRTVAAAQGAYYLGTGLWPFVSERSFLALTGPKFDLWLMKSFSALVVAIGAPLAVAATRDEVSDETAAIACACGVALAASETYYVARGRIRRVYLLDAAIELGCAIGWLRAGLARSGSALAMPADSQSVSPLG